jgi:putative spermidine/putrescine transport system ATP-binding protein
MTSFLRVEQLSAGYRGSRVLACLDLDIQRGEFVALLGSSGCGKTTLLRAIAGFVRPDSGLIAVGGKDVTHLPPDRRGMALVFQSYALWPHMTVSQNIGYGLKLSRFPRAEIAAKVAQMEALLGLAGLGARKPSELSGGQRQRVALGRALAIDPSILLLDEPLSNLDARIRLQVRHEIRALQKRLGITTVHVTHDREEAMVMADRIVILNAGQIAQQGSPEEVYNRPASSFVAAFMGAENTLPLNGSVVGLMVDIEAGPSNIACALPLSGRSLRSGALEARFRAEAARLLHADPGSQDGPAAGLELSGHVVAVTYPGGGWRHTVRIGSGEIQVDADHAVAVGNQVRVHVPPDALYLFNSATGSPPSPHHSLHAGRSGGVREVAPA